MLLNPYRFGAGIETSDMVSVLLHFDGSNDSTTILDSSIYNRTITANGNAKLSTSEYKFNPSSLKLIAGNSTVSIPNADELNFTSGSWTIGVWVFLPTALFNPGVILNKDGVFGVSYQQYGLSINSSRKLDVFLGNGAGSSPTGTMYNGTTVIPYDTWSHIELTCDGLSCYGFVNGNKEWQEAKPNMYDGAKSVLIGGQDSDTSNYFQGYIDELIMIKGLCKHTANFTPPTVPYDNP